MQSLRRGMAERRDRLPDCDGGFVEGLKPRHSLPDDTYLVLQMPHREPNELWIRRHRRAGAGDRSSFNLSSSSAALQMGRGP
ncbi:hypothetical protein HPP92_000736 [Vanilla planifolia]|uniref:Uncharacterized protein n=1 Tax=Vanilla planifolia TaxID=51239 RepID=A0A835VGD7_VANPL|nr:hypothetical protein HPP92_000736 [Vanilla planifolia]